MYPPLPPILLLPWPLITNLQSQLNRKLATAHALLSYEQKCSETRLLEATEKQRQLRVKLLHLGPEYEATLQDNTNQERYITESDKVLAATKERLAWSDGSLLRCKRRNKELEAKLQTQLISKGSEKGIVEAELEALKSRYKAIDEKLKWTRNELEQERKRSENAIEPGELSAAKDEVAVLQREIKTLQIRLQDQATESTANQTRETAEKKELEKELSRLQAEHKSAKNDFTAQTTTYSAEKKELEKQLSQLRTEMKSAHKEPSVDQSQEAKNDELEKQLLRLRTEHKSAQKESTAEKKELEGQLSRLRTEHRSAQNQSTAQITTLENNLLHTQDLLKTAQTTISRLQATAPIPLSVAAEADLKADVAKEIAARKKLEKDFYKFVSDSDEKHALLKSKLDAARAKLKAANAINAASAANVAPVAPTVPLMTMDDLSHSVKRPRKEAPKTSDLSLTPFFAKTAVVTTNSPLTPSAVVVGEDGTVAGDNTMIDRSMRAERSIRIPSAIESTEPTRLLLAGANRKRKLPAKAASPPPAAIPEESSEEEAPRKPQPKKKRAKKAPEKAVPEPVHIFDTPVKEEPKAKPTKKNAAPTSIFDDVPLATKAAPKKRKRPVGSTQAFREDDGTGRLVLAGDSGEASGGSGLTLRPPVTGVFTKEISPPKKRPDVLKRFFAGGKKIQGRAGG